MKFVFESTTCILYLVWTYGRQIELLIQCHQQRLQVPGEHVEQTLIQHFPHLLQEQIVQDMIFCFKKGMIISFYQQLPDSTM